MQTLDITCTQCSVIMGTVRKAEFTPYDIVLYRQCFTCPNGHTSCELAEQDGAEPEAELEK